MGILGGQQSPRALVQVLAAESELRCQEASGRTCNPQRPRLVVTRTDKLASPVDRALAVRGLRRRVVIRRAHFMATLSIVADSDMVIVIPRRLAQKHAEDFDLAVFEVPFALPPFSVYTVGHKRLASSPLHKWLCSMVTDAKRAALVSASFDPQLSVGLRRRATGQGTYFQLVSEGFGQDARLTGARSCNPRAQDP